MLFDIDADPIGSPKDCYTTIANATEAVREGHTTEMAPHTLLYLFEYYRITKINGANNPYACSE